MKCELCHNAEAHEDKDLCMDCAKAILILGENGLLRDMKKSAMEFKAMREFAERETGKVPASSFVAFAMVLWKRGAHDVGESDDI